MEIFLGQKKNHNLVSIPGDVRQEHLAIFGKSGVVKTTPMRSMAVADLDAGNGLNLPKALTLLLDWLGERPFYMDEVVNEEG